MNDATGARDWPHSPPHRLSAGGTYFVTARTIGGIEHFHDPLRRTFVRDALLGHAKRYGWEMEAWAVLSNHYHFVAHTTASQSNAESLRKFLRHLHGDVTRHINRLDRVEGRKLWHNYRETQLTHHESYFARLHYTHNNPVHHRLVEVASGYEWSSAAAFERTCSRAWVNTVYSFKYDQIAIADGDG
jgi:putative transposase